MRSSADNGGEGGTPAGKEGPAKAKVEEKRRNGDKGEWGRRRVSMEKGESNGGEREEMVEKGLPEMVFGEEEKRLIKEGSTEEEREAKGKECECEKEMEEEGGEPVAGGGEEEKPEKDSGEEEMEKGLRGRGGVAVATWKEKSHGGEEG